MHQLHVRNIAVGKRNQIYFVLPNKIGQLIFGIDGYAVWVKFSRKLGWILAVFYVRNLSRRESDNLVPMIVFKLMFDSRRLI